MAIPLKVTILSSGRIAHVCTLDISPSGARISTSGNSFRAGDEILVQYSIERIKARVIWVGEAAWNKGQIGIVLAKDFLQSRKLLPKDRLRAGL